MKILFTNNALNFPAGTQVFIRDLAAGLQRRGNEVAVYTLQAGAFANDMRRQGIVVCEQLKDIPFVPDLIHAQHYQPALEAINFFPKTPAASFIHDRLSPQDMPPRHKRIMQYLTCDFNVYDRLVKDAAIPTAYVDVLLNWVDVSKFPLRTSWNERPRKALVFSNYARKDNYFVAVREACHMAGIPLDAIGRNMGNIVTDPGIVLCDYDIVFAKAKAAMEAMATGAAVIPCDFFGLGKMVSQENFAHYRRFNFGMKILSRPVKPYLILEEIRKYNAQEAMLVAGIIREDADFERYLDSIMFYYQRAVVRYQQGFQTHHREVTFHPLSFWARRKLLSRKREAQKQWRRFQRRLKYG